MNLIEKNNNSYEEELKILGKGHLIHIKCGHKGLLNYEEMKTFNYHLEKSKILPNFNIGKKEEKNINNNDNINNENNKKIIEENL